MRVKFGRRINLCKRVTHTPDSSLLLITTMYDGLYTVDCGSVKTAEVLFSQVLINGYIDVSDFEYSN